MLPGSSRYLAQNSGPQVLARHYLHMTNKEEEQKFGIAASFICLENSYSSFKAQISLPLDHSPYSPLMSSRLDQLLFYLCCQNGLYKYALDALLLGSLRTYLPH